MRSTSNPLLSWAVERVLQRKCTCSHCCRPWGDRREPIDPGGFKAVPVVEEYVQPAPMKIVVNTGAGREKYRRARAVTCSDGPRHTDF